ncbi:CHAT domain-containing protein [Bacteroidota bacterium]
MYDYLHITNHDDTLINSYYRNNSLNDLIYSENEIKSIDSIFKTSGKIANTFLYSNATKKNFIKNAKNYKIIHIATHGIVNEFMKNMPGLIFSYSNKNLRDSLFSPDDYILYSEEFSNLALSADLITLSACESGIGEIVNGEGIINMTRELIYSGAKNILASLWKISDKPTMLLMIDFYKNIQKGNSYSHSLRKAKLNMLKNEKTAHPIHWAGFVLVGN